jgi:hypothetical protein
MTGKMIQKFDKALMFLSLPTGRMGPKWLKTDDKTIKEWKCNYTFTALISHLYSHVTNNQEI